jgi:hypothetical protein
MNYQDGWRALRRKLGEASNYLSRRSGAYEVTIHDYVKEDVFGLVLCGQQWERLYRVQIHVREAFGNESGFLERETHLYTPSHVLVVVVTDRNHKARIVLAEAPAKRASNVGPAHKCVSPRAWPPPGLRFLLNGHEGLENPSAETSGCHWRATFVLSRSQIVNEGIDTSFTDIWVRSQIMSGRESWMRVTTLFPTDL